MDREMAGSERQWTPTSPPPDRGGAQISTTRDPRLVQAKPPSFLNELSKMLEDAQQQASEIAGRLRNNADSLLGGEPEPGRNGEAKAGPPPSGQVHQLSDAVRSICATLREARHQLDRLDAL